MGQKGKGENNNFPHVVREKLIIRKEQGLLTLDISSQEYTTIYLLEYLLKVIRNQL